MCSKLTIKIPERRWRRTVFDTNWGKNYKERQLYYRVGRVLQSEASIITK